VSSASRSLGKRSRILGSTTRAPRRAREAPRQKCTPHPKPRCRVGSQSSASSPHAATSSTPAGPPTTCASTTTMRNASTIPSSATSPSRSKNYHPGRHRPDHDRLHRRAPARPQTTASPSSPAGLQPSSGPTAPTRHTPPMGATNDCQGAHPPHVRTCPLPIPGRSPGEGRRGLARARASRLDPPSPRVIDIPNARDRREHRGNTDSVGGDP
jgi:hypothetical protein